MALINFGVGVNHDELVGLAKQHLSGVSFEYLDDAVPVLSPCRFTGSEVRSIKHHLMQKCEFFLIFGV